MRCGGWRRQFTHIVTSPSRFTFACYRHWNIHIDRRSVDDSSELPSKGYQSTTSSLDYAKLVLLTVNGKCMTQHQAACRYSLTKGTACHCLQCCTCIAVNEHCAAPRARDSVHTVATITALEIRNGDLPFESQAGLVRASWGHLYSPCTRSTMGGRSTVCCCCQPQRRTGPLLSLQAARTAPCAASSSMMEALQKGCPAIPRVCTMRLMASNPPSPCVSQRSRSCSQAHPQHAIEGLRSCPAVVQR